MSNDAQYRDLTKIVPYLPAFNDGVVSRIDKVSIASAVAVGLFGILYFSLAPAATSTSVEISSVKLSGYSCKMISAVSRNVNPYAGGGTGLVSQKSLADFNLKVIEAGKGLAASDIIAQNILSETNIVYENALYDTYEACLADAQTQTACSWLSATIFVTLPPISHCDSRMFCFSLKKKARLTPISSSDPIRLFVNRTSLESTSIGMCNSQANTTTCESIFENCKGLSTYLSKFQEIIRQYVLTPEVVCKPFEDNPPYICTKAAPPSVPSILSQSLAFTTSAFALVKAALFFAVKVFHKSSVVNDSENHSIDAANFPKATSLSDLPASDVAQLP
jgi:hypothetical protein